MTMNFGFLHVLLHVPGGAIYSLTCGHGFYQFSPTGPAHNPFGLGAAGP